MKEYIARCHNLGEIMTHLESISEVQASKIEELQARKARFLMGSDNPKSGKKEKALTPLMEAELNELIEKRDAPPVLPTGAKTYARKAYNQNRWKRKDVVETDKLTKGLYCEEDSLRIMGLHSNQLLLKNTKHFSNGYIQGTPDVITSMVRDAKSSWSKDTFDNAHMTFNNKWQGKAYCWLTGKERFSVEYNLVNAPSRIVLKHIESIWYAMGAPEEKDSGYEAYLRNAQQIERNMIFDIAQFKKDNPFYDFINTELDFDIPKELCHKSFEGELFASDIDNIKMRVEMVREEIQRLNQADLDKIANSRIHTGM